jgi:hypothetical protein
MQSTEKNMKSYWLTLPLVLGSMMLFGACSVSGSVGASACLADNDACGSDGDCCSGVCDASGACSGGAACVLDGDSCSEDSDCCSGDFCDDSSCSVCVSSGNPCGSDGDCCSNACDGESCD